MGRSLLKKYNGPNNGVESDQTFEVLKLSFGLPELSIVEML
jgi:hypothetical protein